MGAETAEDALRGLVGAGIDDLLLGLLEDRAQRDGFSRLQAQQAGRRPVIAREQDVEGVRLCCRRRGHADSKEPKREDLTNEP